MRAVRVILGLIAAVPLGACGPTKPEGVCKAALVAGDLVITEIFADYRASGGGGIDEGKEWFEIFNASDHPIDLTGLTIVHGRPDAEPGDQKTHVIDEGTIAPGAFLTFGNSTPELLSAYIDHGYSDELGELFNSGGGKLALQCGDAEIDAAIYDEIEGGRSRQLSAAAAPDYTVNDNQSNWCSADATEFEPGNFGTPGQDNDCTPRIAGQCRDGSGTRDVVPPAPGELVITEVMPSPDTVPDESGEWFEARARADFDLNGLGLGRASTADPQPIESADCLRVTAGQHVLFARSTDVAVNGQLFPDAVFRFSLVGGPGDVRIMSGGAIIDAVTWSTSRNGHSLSLDPDFATDTGNDDASNFCDGATAYHTSDTGMDFGTPGEPNAQCAAQPQPGECIGANGARRIIKPATTTQIVITEFLANPAGTVGSPDATQEWFEIKNTGAEFDLNGLSLKGNATTVNTITAAECKTVAAGGFALFAHGTDPAQNGMLPTVDATFTFALAQSNGSITVLDGATVLDTVTWTTGILDGASKQLQATQTSTTANDNAANFCNAAATQTYGNTANLGTPKATNVCP